MIAKKKTRINSDFSRMLIILVVLLLFAGITRGSAFMSLVNFQTIGKQLTEYGLMAIGLSMAMITGGIDLSTVYIANLCGAVASLIMSAIAPEGQIGGIVVACLVALLIGLCCGFLNGFLVSVVNVPPMLATLGTYELFYGITVVLSDGKSITVISQFKQFASAMVFGVIPLPFVIFVIVAVIFSILVGKTAFGRRIHLVGVNEKASSFAGIKNVQVITMAYMCSGLLSALAGLISLSRVASVKADFGSSYVMMTILIAVLGGCDPDGGSGEIPGVAVAVVVLQVISAYLNTISWINNYYRQALYGILLLGFMTYKLFRSKSRK
ncbi:MAG: ABC transporter permease [Lachnospiraceae bacterium]|nr:ABC transporter permease [Lachnospiraceae bacterium]